MGRSGTKNPIVTTLITTKIVVTVKTIKKLLYKVLIPLNNENVHTVIK
jgi:hypothetical protein